MSFNCKAVAFCAASTLLCWSSAYAEEGQPEHAALPLNKQPTVELAKRWIVNVSVERVSMDEEVTASQWVEPDANAIMFEAEYYLNQNWSTVVGLGYLQYDDLNGFSQLTESIYGGDVDSSGSTASALPLVFDFGYTRFTDSNVPFYYTLRGGTTYLLASERSIENCTDCYSEDIEIDGGVFAQAGFGFNPARWLTIGLYYKSYFSGDIEDSIGIKFAFGRFRSN